MAKQGTGDGCGHRVGPRGGGGYMGLLTPTLPPDDDATSSRHKVSTMVARFIKAAGRLHSASRGQPG